MPLAPSGSLLTRHSLYVHSSAKTFLSLRRWRTKRPFTSNSMRKCSSVLSREMTSENPHAKLPHLLLGECVLKTITEDEHQGKALAELVGTGGRARGPGSTHLVKHPMLGGIQPLHMLLWTTSHVLGFLGSPC